MDRPSAPTLHGLLKHPRWPNDPVCPIPALDQGPGQMPRTHPRLTLEEVLEEVLFIWHHRIDIRMGYPELLAKFEAQFGTKPPKCLNKGHMIQLHRTMGIPNLAELSGEAERDGRERYGMVGRTGLWFPWIEEIVEYSRLKSMDETK